jgi:hypothetical protein
MAAPLEPMYGKTDKRLIHNGRKSGTFQVIILNNKAYCPKRCFNIASSASIFTSRL